MEEELSSSENKVVNFVRSNALILGLLAVGIVLIVVGLIQFLSASQTQIKFEEGTNVENSKIAEIKVDVDGAVINPGLYTLKEDARVQDALIAAGGLTADANRAVINLAQKLLDGQKIYIPARDEEVSLGSPGTVLSSESPANGLISINSASQSRLEELPGIGPVRAAAIIDGRPYSSIDELRSKGILGEKTFEAVKDLVSL